MGLLDDVGGLAVGQVLGGPAGGGLGLAKELGLGISNVNVPSLDPNAQEASNQLLAQSKTLAGQAGQLGDVGSTLLKDFSTGTLTAGQEAETKLAEEQMTAKTSQYFASAGLSGSSIAASAAGENALKLAAFKEQLNQGNFSMALQAMGMSAQDLGLSDQALEEILGVGVAEQKLDLSAQSERFREQNALIEDIVGGAGAAGAFMGKGSGDAPIDPSFQGVGASPY